jgi:uncharacterized membrane protein
MSPTAYVLLRLAHVLGVVLWVGGMAFAHFFLRPAAQPLEPAQRLALMQRVLQRFLAWAGVSVLVVVASGVVLVALGVRSMGINAMALGGLAMAAIYLLVRYAAYPRLARAVAAQQWPQAGAALAPIRRWVGINLALGVVVIAVAVLARLF